LVVVLSGCAVGSETAEPRCTDGCAVNGTCHSTDDCTCDEPTSCTYHGQSISFRSCCEPKTDEDCIASTNCSYGDCCVTELDDPSRPGRRFNMCMRCER
jgi:hypothetical protein